MGAFEAIAAAFGGVTILVGLLGYLGQKAVTHWLDKETKAFQQRLESQASESAERLKAALQLAALEHQVRFTKLHEKRGEVIEAVHHMLADLLWNAQAATSIVHIGGVIPDSAQELINADAKRAELYRYFQKHRIYLPIGTAKRIETLLDAFRERIVQFDIWREVDDFAPQGLILKRQEEILAAFTYFTDEVWKPMEELESAFRELIDPGTGRRD